jgi:hypothetical protein
VGVTDELAGSCLSSSRGSGMPAISTLWPFFRLHAGN